MHNFIFSEFTEILGNIFNYRGSVNFYMFHGGTNFGFMNGANIVEAKGVPIFPFYAPDVTSYGMNNYAFMQAHYPANTLDESHFNFN